MRLYNISYTDVYNQRYSELVRVHSFAEIHLLVDILETQLGCHTFTIEEVL